MPWGRFGANAAWFRLAVLTDNIFTALKRLAFPAELLTVRPKRLRFLILNTPGKLIHHARRTLLRLAQTANHFSNWRRAFGVLALPVATRAVLHILRRFQAGYRPRCVKPAAENNTDDPEPRAPNQECQSATCLRSRIPEIAMQSTLQRRVYILIEGLRSAHSL
jgi:hypothetical protein